MSDTTTSQSSIKPVEDVELLLLRKRQLELQRARVVAIKKDGLPFYAPHPKQDAFHRSTALRRGAFTGNRFGKSTMGIAEDCAWLRGERPWYPLSDPARRSGIPQRPVKGVIVVNDWDKAKEIFTGDDGKLWRFLPKDGFIKRCTRNHSGAIDTLHCANGSSLRFETVQSFKSNPGGAESSDWDFIHGDEPFPEAMWKAMSRGLVDRKGSAWILLTALSEPWITDAFEPTGQFEGHCWATTGSIFDNPNLSPDAIKLYEATLTDEEKECRLHGIPLHRAGCIYKQYDRAKHVLTELPTGWTSWMEPPASWSYYLYIDPHPRTPHMVLFLAVDPFGRKYYFHDIFEHCVISELCLKIRKVLNGRKLVRVRLDPIAWIEDAVHATTIANEFIKCGIHVEKASKDLSRGILRVQEALQQPKPLHPLFTPNCRRTLWEITRYHWDEETNKPVDADDHAMECLYRSILDEPRYVDPQDLKTVIEDITIVRPELDLPEPVGGMLHEELVLTEESLMLN